MKKFKTMFKLLLVAFILYAPSAMAMTCEMSSGKLIMRPDSGNNIEVNQQIPQLVHTVIVVLKIAVPIILIILGMIDLLKGVTASKEDEIKKRQNMFFKRLIAAVLVFFVITVVQLVISFFDTDKENIMDCANCFINNKCGSDTDKAPAIKITDDDTSDDSAYVITLDPSATL